MLVEGGGCLCALLICGSRTCDVGCTSPWIKAHTNSKQIWCHCLHPHLNFGLSLATAGQGTTLQHCLILPHFSSMCPASRQAMVPMQRFPITKKTLQSQFPCCSALKDYILMHENVNQSLTPADCVHCMTGRCKRNVDEERTPFKTSKIRCQAFQNFPLAFGSPRKRASAETTSFFEMFLVQLEEAVDISV